MSMRDITQDELTCKHVNSISVYDSTCHVQVGVWYCTDCKTVWCEKCGTSHTTATCPTIRKKRI